MFKRWSGLFGPAEWFLVILLVTTVVACGLEIVFGGTPWTAQVREALAAGTKLTIRGRIAIGLRYGVYATLAGAVFMLLLTPWWAVRRDMPPPKEFPKGSLVSGRWFYPVLMAALVCAAWFRVPAINHSFWNDEELAFRKFNWGDYRANGAGELKFHRVPWDYAFFYSNNGNNHVAQTVLSKFTHELWMKFQGISRETPTFSEAAVRAGPLLFGLLTIVALALALRSVGLSVTAMIAAWILALHPWHVAYSVQARGYSGMLFFIVLSFWCLGLAMRVPKWKWWLLFGAFQCLYLLHFAGAIYLAVATNLIVFGILLKSREFFGMRRWFVASAFSALAFVLVMAPSLMAIFTYLSEHGSTTGGDMAAWLRDLWAHLSIGMPWAATDPTFGWGTGASDLLATRPWLGFVWQWLLPLLLIGVTVIVLSTRLRYLSVFFGSLLGGMVFAVGHSMAKDTVLFEWYLLYLMLGVVFAVGLLGECVYRAFQTASSRSGRKISRARGLATAASSLALVVLYGLTTATQRQAYRDHDVQPMRQAVRILRGEAPAIDARHQDMITASVGPGCGQLVSYDPRVQCCHNVDELRNLVGEAESSGRPLGVYCGCPGQLEQLDPEMYRELNESGHFAVVATLKATDGFWSFRLYRAASPGG